MQIQKSQALLKRKGISSYGSTEEMQGVSKVNRLETRETSVYFLRAPRSKRKNMTPKIACPLFNAVHTLFPNQN